MVVALGDDAHVAEQRERYRARREVVLPALARRGLRAIDHSEAGLYLWATRDEDCWDTVAALAERGVLVAPGASTARPGAPARPGRADRDRRADRRSARAARRRRGACDAPERPDA